MTRSQAIRERKKILVQFIVCFHMLTKSKTMINYESMSKLLHLLNVKKILKTHWSNKNG
jgi:hypothetical protein